MLQAAWTAPTTDTPLCTPIPNRNGAPSSGSFQQGAYKGHNVMERCFCRLKDFRRLATRYDKLARNFLAAFQIAALVAYWI